MPNNQIAVSFRTGNYKYYDESNWEPGCLYYLKEYQNPDDENSTVVQTYIFLNGVRYNADTTVDPMAKFGEYHPYANYGIITPDAPKLRILRLQVPQSPQTYYDVANKEYVDNNSSKLYVIDANDDATTKMNTITSYLNATLTSNPSLVFVYHIATGSVKLALSNIESRTSGSNRDSMTFHFNDIYYPTLIGSRDDLIFRDYAIEVIYTFSNSSNRYSVDSIVSIRGNLIIDSDPISDNIPESDGLIPTVGAVKEFVNTKTAALQWQQL